ncbi:MAG: helix-turn-helix domain-containing protein, partial [Planctomycetes bacterium]|nr:helix-turn-helix domain-containing protein [Planctomycetota bacterium]
MRSLKWRAVDLRRRGWSYNIIAARLGVSKSTLSHWLREVPYEPNKTMIERIRLGPARAAASKERRRSQQILLFRAQGRKELGKLSARDLRLLGLGVYLGEG